MNVGTTPVILGTPAIGAAVFAVAGAVMVAPWSPNWVPTVAGAMALIGWSAGHGALQGLVNPGARMEREIRRYEMEANREKQQEQQEREFVMRAEIERNGYKQVDFFRGLTAEQWRKVAVSVAAAKNFTVRTVGQTEHPKLVPMMLAAEYIYPVGQGMYKLTDDGLCWWISLAQSPYPWKVVPKKIATLSMDWIHTQYTQARRGVA